MPKSIHLWIASSVALGSLAITSPVLPQPIPDATLPVNSVVTTQGNTSTITGGTRAGRNLFHSFGSFSVSTGSTAYFNNALDIQNIISRVTGGSSSNIDGVIKANGVANLFLINPNGIMFGPHASLNIGGSFLASTANSLKFADGIEFSAKAPETTPLLTMAVPIGLQLGTSAGSITNRSTAVDSQGNPVGLQVMDGNNLALVGGNVSLDSGNLTASGGRVELGGLSQAGMVGLNPDGSLSFPTGVARGDVSLTNQTQVDVTAGNAGNITLTARNIDLQQSLLLAGIRKGLGAVGSKAGDVTLNTTNALSLSQASVVRNQVNANATGDAGDVNVTAGALAITDGSRMSASTFGQGNGGNINVNVSGSLTLAGINNAPANMSSRIVSDVSSGAVGNGGTITIKAGSLSVRDGALLSTEVLSDSDNLPGGRGNAGNINIQVGGDITFDRVGQENGETSPSRAISDVRTGAQGKAGDITITAHSLSLTNGAGLSSSTYGMGNAGKVSVHTDGDISLANSIILSTVESGAVGNGGTIDINSTAGSLKITGGAQLETLVREAAGTGAGSTQPTAGGQGNAGNINIQVGKDVTFDGVGQVNEETSHSGASSFVGTGARGNGGDITIAARSLSLSNGAQLSSSTLGMGNAGSINIQVGGDVTFDGVGQVNEETISSGALSEVQAGAQGNGGDITIAAHSLSLMNGAVLESRTFGRGNAGKVSVQTNGDISLAGNQISLAGNQTGILSSVESGAVGNGGTIDINSTAGSLKLTAGAQLNTFVREAAGTGAGSTPPTSGGQGNAGNINIKVGKDVTFDGVTQANGETYHSGTLTEVGPGAQGNGGDITIAAHSLSLTSGAVLATSTFGTGNAGSVNINARNGVFFDGTGIDGYSSGVYTQSNNMPGINRQAGDIAVNTAAFRLANGAVLASQTASPSEGGNVTINATTFEATKGGQVLTSTASSGKAGDIVLHVTDSVTLSGSDPTYQQRLQQFGPDVVSGEGASSGLFANTAAGSTGNGGSISIHPNQLTIANGAQVAVGSMGQGEAGNIFLQAGAITLNHGFVSATAANVNGGNIFVQAPESLLLRHGSQISATAGTGFGGGNGGNISIDNTALVIAFPTENSDISANAFRGNGGSVKINAAGIFGLQSQPADTSRSDITASSTGGGINGVVNINTLDVDPSRGLVALPVILADTSKQIASGCAAGNGTTGSRFVVTGRGGLPSNPSEPLSSEAVWSDTRFVAATGKPQHSYNISAPQTSASDAVAIVPATGWVFDGKGDVTLTAAVPSERIQVPWLTPASCQTR